MLWQEGFVVDVVVHTGADRGLGVYRKEVTEGEHNKYQSNQSITKRNMAIGGVRCALTR